MNMFIDALKTFVERNREGRGKRSRRRSSHEPLSFETLQPRQLLAAIAVSNGAWTDTSTWENGVLPDSSMRAIINPGVTVELDGVDQVAKELVIRGSLVVTEEVGVDKTLKTRWVHVNSNGKFIVGSEADRYDDSKFTLTLTGTDVLADHTIEGVSMTVMNNDGFLMTADGGSVQFFGEDKLSFTKLAATANVGDTMITVANVIERNFAEGGTANGEFITSAANDGAVNWKENDQIVIASSSYDYNEEEVRTITDVNDNMDGTTTLTFAEALGSRHYGEIETYSGATSNDPATRTYKIDMRAEVALLSRNVKIQGDPTANQDTDVNFGDRANMQQVPRVRADGLSDAEWNAAPDDHIANGVGGHVMIMNESGPITVDGVQLDGLGQSSRKGRYPIHWHNANNRPNDVLKNSSITNSNNRGVTIHGTSGLKIEGVVLHDIHGHGFFFEDAIETDNVLVANIAMGIHTVGGNDANSADPGGKDPFVVDTHDSVLETGSRFRSSAAFWITNPNNKFIGNIAAGAGDARSPALDYVKDAGPAGTGFWFAIPRAALGDASGSGIAPIFAEFGTFDNNSSHTTAVGLNFDRGSDLEDAADPNINLDDIQPANEYSPREGGVEGGNKLSYFVNGFTNYKASDAAFYHRGEKNSIQLNGLRVADSYNGPWAVSENVYNNSLFVGNSSGNADTTVIVGGPRLYDGAGLYTDSHFAGFAEDNAFVFQVEGSSFGPTMYHAFSDTSFENDGTIDNIAHAVSDFTRGPDGDFRESHDLGRPAQWSKGALDLDGTLTSGLGGAAGSTIVPNVEFLVNVDDGDVLLPGGKAVLTNDIYARIRVENKDDGNDRFEGDHEKSFNETLLRFVNQDGEVIEATEGQNNGGRSWIQAAAKADVQGTFTVEFGRTGVPETGFVLNMKNQDGGRPNSLIQAKVDAARIVVKIVGAQNFTPDYTPNSDPSAFTEVFNDTDLRLATSGVAYLRDAATGDLYLNLGIVDSQDRILFSPNGDGPLQSASESRKVEYGTTIQALQFDNGIEGIAFHDTSAAGVDATSTEITNIEVGEWLEYTTEIVGNAYNVGINFSSAAAGGKIRILAGLSNSAGFLRNVGELVVTDTGEEFKTVWLDDAVDLTFAKGDNSVIRIEFIADESGGGFDSLEFGSFEFAPATQTSYVAGRTIESFTNTLIELEEYDEGGQGAAYFDDTSEILDYQSEAFDIAGNDSSNTHRADEDVDANEDQLQGKVFDGEWLEYTTNIHAGKYDITLNKEWGGDDNSVKLFIAEANSATSFTQLGEFEFTTGDSETITLSDIDLTPWAGSGRVIRIEIVGNWMGLNSIDFNFVSTATAVQQRGIFYGNSAFSGGGVEMAMAPDKAPLMPGEIATFENYTSSLAGINGLAIDVVAVNPANISADDFVFRFGISDDVSSWTTITPAVTVTVDTGSGNSGTDRIVLEFPDGEIVNGWLETTMLANADTGLAVDEVFYFGNAIAETGNSTTDAIVNLADVGLARVNQTGFVSADVDNRYDFNRDGRVNLADVGIARSNQSGFTPLRLINLSSTNRSTSDGSGTKGIGDSQNDFASMRSGLPLEGSFQAQTNFASQGFRQNRDSLFEGFGERVETAKLTDELLTLSGHKKSRSNQAIDAGFEDDRNVEFGKTNDLGALDQAFVESMSAGGFNGLTREI